MVIKTRILEDIKSDIDDVNDSPLDDKVIIIQTTNSERFFDINQ